MATTSTVAISKLASSQAIGAREDRMHRRKREQRTDIWSGLLRQTREAQSRNRTQAVQHRELIICGGSSEDQRSLVESLTRAAPQQAPVRNQERRQQRPEGELRLSNRYAYGYGHMTLFSPPQQTSAGVQVLGAESEEVARIELHTLPVPELAYVRTLRRLLRPVNDNAESNSDGTHTPGQEAESVAPEPRQLPSVCVLLSWKEPWKFLSSLQRWIQLLAHALLPGDQPTIDPLEVIKDAQLEMTVVVQHTESQEYLLRDGYKEEDFDYISQCLRTAILPLHPLSALVYTNTSGPPQQPGSHLSEIQKVVYLSLRLNLALLSPKVPRSSDGAKREEIEPKHEFMDRMAIVIPRGWDSAAFVRTLSETFSPEDLLGAWLADLQSPASSAVQIDSAHINEPSSENQELKQTSGGAEVFESSPLHESYEEALAEAAASPSKLYPSAVQIFETKVLDPQAHKASRPPQVEVTTKADQQFLAEMRAHLQELEVQDRERENTRGSSGISNTSLSGSRVAGMPTGEQSGALNNLGDVSFNVGGVSYDTVSAEAAIERLRRPQHGNSLMDLPSPISGTRTSTPKPHRQHKDGGGKGTDGTLTPQIASAKDALSPPLPSSSAGSRTSTDPKDLPIERLEEYFQSLMKKGGGFSGAGRESTPARSKGE